MSLAAPLRTTYTAYQTPTIASPTQFEAILSSSRTETDNGTSIISRPMFSELNRLKTFEGWPSPYVKPESLAKAGFYYTKYKDRVHCPFCHLEVESWEQGDDAFTDHRKWSHDCPFVKGYNCGNVPIGKESDASQMSAEGFDTCGRYGVEIRPNSIPEKGALAKYALPRSKGPMHPDYVSVEQRIESYKDWPIAIKQKPKLLSEAGFFYTGKGDKTVCFYCGGGLKNWEENDDPWEQHAKWFSSCGFLILQKGHKFIADVSNNSNPVINTSEALAICGTSGERSSEVPSETVSIRENPSASSSSTFCEANLTCKAENNTPSEPTLCKICYNKEMGVVFLPCGHIVACVNCAPALTKCAVCCGKIEASCRVFLT